MNIKPGRARRLARVIVLALSTSAMIDAQEMYSGEFGQQSGEEIYTGICQGCHMPDAKGALGAGNYPALAGNPRLAATIYPITVVLNGQRAMPSFGYAAPPFGAALTNAQIANVLNYVRTHFGNHYKDVITPDEVKIARREPEKIPSTKSPGTNPASH
jgi:mono/diheme cytochrome c family protein